MKISMKEITRAIRENQYAPEKKWEYESIEFIKTVDTMYGRMDKYEVTVRFKAAKYDDNGIKFEINHYVDANDVYGCYYNGSCYLG